MRRFTGKTAIITGAGSGIGRATAARFHAEGGNAVLLDSNTEALDSIGRDLDDSDHVMTTVVDVTDRAAVDGAVGKARDRFGRLDILAHCAGITGSGTVSDIPLADWTLVQNVNLVGTLNLLQAFAQVVRRDENPASIITVTSVGGLLGVPNRAAYGASKHAVIGLTKSMAMEVGQFGIRVNAVAPGMVRTPMTAYNFEATGGEEAIRRAHPIGRAGEPEEIAAAILFLASDDASFITGTILPVDGGYTAGKGWS